MYFAQDVASNTKLEVDQGHFPAGIYFVRLKGKNFEPVVKKIVKMRD